MPKPNEPYTSDKEVLEVVSRFESCELPTADFNHREHLIVALCYLTARGRRGGARAPARGNQEVRGGARRQPESV